jgi:hypothetical protein
VNLDRLCRAALKRLHASIDTRIEAAHEKLAPLGAFHRRGLAQKFRADRQPKEKK